jgi:hypothetical protein
LRLKRQNLVCPTTCFGAAVAFSPLGTWASPNQPTIDTTMHSFNHQIASNLDVTKRHNGKYQLIYKVVIQGKIPFGATVLHCVAISYEPEGQIMGY